GGAPAEVVPAGHAGQARDAFAHLKIPDSDSPVLRAGGDESSVWAGRDRAIDGAVEQGSGELSARRVVELQWASEEPQSESGEDGVGCSGQKNGRRGCPVRPNRVLFGVHLRGQRRKRLSERPDGRLVVAACDESAVGQEPD